MNNFTYQRKTKLIFGKDQLQELPNEILNNGSRVLLTYGQASIKKTGLYDKVVKLLNDNNIFFVELSGIKPNPEVDTVRQGVALINEHKLDFILSVGGGSVLDNSKHMAISHALDHDIWDIVLDPSLLKPSDKFVKIGCILTISATGSEMNDGGVISNPETMEKLATSHPQAAPNFSFLDPSILETLPKNQRIAGVCDTVSHLLEMYFSQQKDDGFADRIIESIMLNVINYSDTYINDNLDYEANAQIMLSATYALNGLTGLGRYQADWKTHGIEHELSAFTDFTHGIGLALIHPYVIETYYQKDIVQKQSLVKFINLGRNVFKLVGSDDEVALACQSKIKETFFNWITKTKLSEYGINDFDYMVCVDRLVDNHRLSSSYHKLEKEDLIKIYQQIL